MDLKLYVWLQVVVMNKGLVYSRLTSFHFHSHYKLDFVLSASDKLHQCTTSHFTIVLMYNMIFCVTFLFLFFFIITFSSDVALSFVHVRITPLMEDIFNSKRKSDYTGYTKL